jgi:hypothetical protein
MTRFPPPRPNQALQATAASAASNATSGAWKNLEDRFAELGAENALQVDPNTMNAEEGNAANRLAEPGSR